MVALTAASVVMQQAGCMDRQAEFDRHLLSACRHVCGESYIKVHSVGMVGIYVGVFIRSCFVGAVSNVVSDRIPTGLHGRAGNKGAVAVRLKIYETSLCALALHLESGDKVVERTMQLREISQRCFQQGGAARGTPTVEKHDVAILAGDFNFRMAVPPNSDTQNFRQLLQLGWSASHSGGPAGLIGEGVLAECRQDYIPAFKLYDELQGSRVVTDASDCLRVSGLTEGPVYFPATYRFREGTNEYDLERMPSWCDRVLHNKVGVTRRRYCALGEGAQSDHRAVHAFLETSLLAFPGTEVASQDRAASAKPVLPQVRESGNTCRQEAQSCEDLLQFVVTPELTPLQVPAAQSLFRPPASPRLPGRIGPGLGPVPEPGSLTPGQLVLASHDGSWYFANVLQSSHGTCDVSWLRPSADLWGSDVGRYLCSTGADETLHGTGLSISTHIRLPQLANDAAPLQKPVEETTNDLNEFDLLG
jgi:hypothetical protein